jgi:hypothetical protein
MPGLAKRFRIETHTRLSIGQSPTLRHQVQTESECQTATRVPPFICDRFSETNACDYLKDACKDRPECDEVEQNEGSDGRPRGREEHSSVRQRCGNFAARARSRQTGTPMLVKRRRFNPCVQPRLSLTRLRKHLYAFILWITEYLVHPCQPKCGSSRSNYGYGLWRVLEVFASDSIRLDDIDKPAIAEQSQRIGQPVTNASS